MNGSLGRDKIWNQQIWSDIDKAVQEEVGRIRVAQKVFPSAVVNNVLPVVANTLAPGPGPLRTGVDRFQPFFEISRDFALTQAQVEGEENTHLAPSLARLAASMIAAAEDTLVFFGGTRIAAVLATGVTVTNQPSLPAGFVAEAAAHAATPVPGAVAGGVLGNILAAVAQGIAALSGRAQPGPYALFLPPAKYAQTFEPPAGQLKAPGDQINHVVTGGCYMVNSLAQPPPPPARPRPDIGILVSLGGEPAKIILGTDAITAFTFMDGQSDYHFRVFERIQMVVRDGLAFQTLTFP
jgi:uncharacterized linocin/CFP29 family protein